MSFAVELRKMATAQKREERAALRREKEFNRQLKERAKLSALEEAQLEFEAFENSLQVLLTVHQEQIPAVDWTAFASACPPHTPPRLGRHILASFQARLDPNSPTPASDALVKDDEEHQARLAEHAEELERWGRLRELARRVLHGAP